MPENSCRKQQKKLLKSSFSKIKCFKNEMIWNLFMIQVLCRLLYFIQLGKYVMASFLASHLRVLILIVWILTFYVHIASYISVFSMASFYFYCVDSISSYFIPQLTFSCSSFFPFDRKITLSEKCFRLCSNAYPRGYM